MNEVPRIDRLDQNFFRNGACHYSRSIGTSFNDSTGPGPYPFDRWQLRGAGGLPTLRTLRSVNVPSTGLDLGMKYQHSMRFQAQATGSGERSFSHNFMLCDALKLVGQKVTIAFLVRSNQTGPRKWNHSPTDSTGVQLANTSGTFTIDAADTWEKKVIKTTWSSVYPTGGDPFNWGAVFNFTLGTATPADGPNLFSSTSNYLEVVGFRLYVGWFDDPPFNHSGWSLDKELGLLLPFYAKSYPINTAPGTTGNPPGAWSGAPDSIVNNYHFGTMPFPAEMRTTPVMTFYNPNDGNTSTPVWNGAGNAGFSNYSTSPRAFSGHVNNVSTGVGQTVYIHWAANAELG